MKRMAAFAGNYGFNLLHVEVQQYCLKEIFLTLLSNTFITRNSRKRTSLSATEQVTIVLHSGVLSKKALM